MKKVRKTWMKEQGVSPVIATILMVAITVVLAAVLYVMVMNINNRPDITPTINWVSAGAVSSTEAKLVFGTPSAAVRPMDIKVIVTDSGGGEFTLSLPAAPAGEDTNMSVSGGSGQWAVYHDYSPQGNSVNQGDYILVHGLSPGTAYTVKVLYMPTESVAPGSDTSFSTP